MRRNTKKTIILFNGPPRSGKDTACSIVDGYLEDSKILRFSEPLKNAVHSMFGLNVPHDHFEHVKDEPQLLLGGRTPRDCYIDLSESYVKPTFGKGFWGTSLENSIRFYAWCSSFLIPDLGFISELTPLIETLGIENINIVQVYREGKNFDNDSRGYINLEGVRTFKLYNNGSIEDLRNNCKFILEDIYIKEYQ